MKRGLIAAAIVVAVGTTSVFIAASVLAKRFDPYIRQEAITYLSKRFESDVEIGKLSIAVPHVPLMHMFWTRGKGVIAKVTGENIVLRHRGRRDVPPMFSMGRFEFEADLGEVFAPVKHISLVRLERMDLIIPPKGDRPTLTTSSSSASNGVKVVIDRIILTDSRLVILPKDTTRKPLDFDLHRVVLDSVGGGQPFKYRATLTNAVPPGMIDANGQFGPWNASSPGDTLLNGAYLFQNADLGVFSAIQGILTSQGSFEGTLDAVKARGEADVPDFRLRGVGNPVFLHTQFAALVDGTNGNTVLEPVHVRLGTTSFVTSGAILKREGNHPHSIDLDVTMQDGEMLDLLRLATKAKPFLSGRLQMVAKIRIPPLNGTIQNKLILDGRFHIRRGQFLDTSVQSNIDMLSRRGQGQPKNESIDNVFSDMAGSFHMENQNIRLRELTFEVPGSRVSLAGQYNVAKDSLDFQGSLSLEAHVSETMTGWKHWLLKAADPFFARNGAGTYLKIKVTGTSQDPHFGASW
jgi:hypothetical protein